MYVVCCKQMVCTGDRMASMTRRNCIFAAILVVCSLSSSSRGATDDSLDRLVAEDWAAQERRLDRSPADPRTIKIVYDRTQALLNHLLAMPQPPDLATDKAHLGSLAPSVADVNNLDEAGRLALYHQVRSAAREIALKNPLIAGKRIAFLKRHRFVCQMLHEYLGYFYDYADISGGGVYVLERPGQSLETRDIVQNHLPKGNYTTLALSYDASTLYFGFAERAEVKPDYYSPQRRCFHIWAANVDATNLRQLTDGCNDDFDPCPLPDGGIAFMSTRRGGFGAVTTPGSPCRPIRCTGWTLRATTCGRFPSTRPTNGTRWS